MSTPSDSLPRELREQIQRVEGLRAELATVRPRCDAARAVLTELQATEERLAIALIQAMREANRVLADHFLGAYPAPVRKLEER